MPIVEFQKADLLAIAAYGPCDQDKEFSHRFHLETHGVNSDATF
jgi:hypothetical protein